MSSINLYSTNMYGIGGRGTCWCHSGYYILRILCGNQTFPVHPQSLEWILASYLNARYIDESSGHKLDIEYFVPPSLTLV